MRQTIRPFYRRMKDVYYHLPLRIRLTVHLSLMYGLAVLLILVTNYYGIPGTPLVGEVGDFRQQAFRLLTDISAQETNTIHSWFRKIDQDIIHFSRSPNLQQEILELAKKHQQDGLDATHLRPLFEYSWLGLAFSSHLDMSQNVRHVDIYALSTGALLYSSSPGTASAHLDSLIQRQVIENSDTLLVGRAVWMENDSSLLLPIGRTIRDSDGVPLVVLTMTVNPTTALLTSMDRGLTSRVGTELVLVDDLGRNILPLAHRVEGTAALHPLGMTIQATPALRAAQGQYGGVVDQDYRGVKVLAAYGPVELPGGHHWGLVVKQDYSSVFRPLYTRFITNLAIAFVMLIAGMVWIYLIVRGATRPLEQLAAVSRLVGAGDLSQRSGIDRKDEIGQLSSTFDTMIDQIDEWYHEIEATVERRTEQLYRSSTLLDLALSSFSGGIWEVRYQTNEGGERADLFITLSDKLAEAIGFGAASITMSDTDWGERFHPERRAELIEIFRDIFEGRCDSLEEVYRFRHEDGTYHWYLTHGACMKDRDDNKLLFVGMQIDITELKQSEIENQRLLDRFEALVNASPLAILLVDQNDRVLLWNPAAEKMFGWETEDVIGQPNPILTPEAHKTLHASRLALLEQKTSNQHEVQVSHKDGTMIDTSFSSALLHDTDGQDEPLTLLLFEDISDRIRYLDALKKSEERYSLAEDITGIGVWEWNIESENIHSSDQVIEMFDLPKKNSPLSVNEVMNRIHPDDRSAWEKSVRKSILKGVRHELDFRIVRQDGSIRWLRVIGDAHTEGEKRATRMIGMIMDITERREWEDKLKESEARYRLLFRDNPHPMWVFDIETLAFLDVSTSAILKYGYTHDEFLNMTIKDIRPPDDLPKLLDNLQTSLDEYQQSSGWRHRLKSGSIIDVEITSHEIEYMGRKARLVLANDITERRKAETSLIKRTRQLQEMGSLAKVGAWEFDVITGEGSWTEEVARIHDLPLTTATNRDLGIEFYTPESRQKIESAIQNAIGDQVPYDLVLDMVTAKNNQKWIRTIGQPVVENGEVVKLQGSFQDITPLVEAEMALRENMEKYRLLADNSLDVIWQMNLQLQYIYVNPAVFDIFGYTADEYIGTHFRDHTTPEEFHRVKGILWQNIEDPGQPSSSVFESVQFDKHHRPVPVEIHGQLLRDETGVPYLLQGVSRNISERVQAREALIELNTDLEKRVELRTTQLEFANKELQTFAYSVSHDLRAPLRALSGFSTALREEYGSQLDTQAGHYLDRIYNATVRMGELIEALLSLSRVTRADYTFTTIDFSALCWEVVDVVAQNSPVREIEILIEEGLSIEGDERMIRNMMLNLLGNAFKFTRKKPDPKIEVYSEMVKGERVFHVRDNGVGFNEAYASKLFTPFQRLHTLEEFEGSGIGLATVDRIVKRHGGWIRATGKVDEGVTITFFIGTEQGESLI